MVKTDGVQDLMRSRFIRDLPIVTVGCALGALAIDMFMVPQGLAAGGVTGLATIISALGGRGGVDIPVGLLTIVMNALLLLAAVRAGGKRYAVQTAVGFVLLGLLTDLLAPLVAPFSAHDLMLSALWGGIISGLGYGLVLRCGANTGGSDTIAQIISRKTSLPVGATVMVIDVAVCAASAPVFSLENALYAALSMVLMGFVVDLVVDGAERRRAAYIISCKHDEIAAEVLHGMDRGVTELSARGMWTGQDRPVLLVIVDRREVAMLKAVVRRRDPDALMFISDVSEAIGEGFKDFDTV